MELVNEVTQFLNSKEKKDDTAWSVIREAIETSVVLLSPVVPHISEEMWEMLGRDKCLITVPWPGYREDALEVENRLVVLQVNGKVRSRIEVPVSYSEDEIEAEALADERIRRFIDGKPVRKVIVVQKKLVNVVV
jgi:leucyl-tRNA synthetase